MDQFSLCIVSDFMHEKCAFNDEPIMHDPVTPRMMYTMNMDQIITAV